MLLLFLQGPIGAAVQTTSVDACEHPRMSDRFGVRWGLAGGIALASIDEVRGVARYAVAAGFDSLWISHANAVDPIVALAATADENAGLAEVGTSVVPLYGRHPIGLAQLARTAQSALDGRFTLGIGAASRRRWRPAWACRGTDRWPTPATSSTACNRCWPAQADVDGTEVTTHGVLNINAADTPILLAALGPKMLELAGRRVQGTTGRSVRPRTIASYIAPRDPGRRRRRRDGRSRASWP